jgi:AraC family transcriptional regulator, melibiose operon regulatory protein
MLDPEIPSVCMFDERRPELKPYGLTCVRWRPTLMRRPDRHNELEVNLLRSGTLTYLLRGRRVTVVAGHLTIFWALEPHQIIHFEGDGFYYVATIPFTWFLQWQMPPAFLSQIMAGAVLKESNAGAARLDEAIFERWLLDVESNSPEIVDVMMLELEARLKRLALSYETAYDRHSDAAGEGSSSADRSISKVEQMAVFIAAHYREPILIRDIGEAVGLHPDYANVLFRETFGMTLGDYLLEQRIAHAQRMLATTREKIACVAYESGFGSITRFNAAFKDVSGRTPMEYRRQHLLHEPSRK